VGECRSRRLLEALAAAAENHPLLPENGDWRLVARVFGIARVDE
jgi:hypothetical protein